MRIATINYCGTVGKTTIAANLLVPRMNGNVIFSIESINGDLSTNGVESIKMRGDRFSKFYDEIVLEDDAVIDIGASNVESFLNQMITYEDGFNLIDLYVIPVVDGEKEKKESIQTAITLIDIGISPDAIKFIINRAGVDYEEDFKAIFNAAKKLKITLNSDFVIRENDLFRLLEKSGRTIQDAIDDKEDHKAKAKELKQLAKKSEESGDTAAAKKYNAESLKEVQLMKQQAMAKTLIQSFDTVYEAICK